MNEYRNKYPGISIKISSLSSLQALSALKAGIVDFAIVTTPIQKDSALNEVKVKEFREIAICGEALKNKLDSAALELKDLIQYPIVSFEKGRSTHTFYTELFAKQGVNFSSDIEAATADQIIPIVKHNLGISFIPEQFLYDEPNGIYKLNLKEQIPTREICVVTRKGHSPSLAVRELEKMMLEK